MNTNKLRNQIQQLLNLADIKLNGNRLWDIKVNDERLYRRVLSQGSLGLGEAYMDEWWDCESIDQMLDRAFETDLDKKVKNNWKLILNVAATQIFNMQNKNRARVVGEKHYDIGNDLYEAMLDARMAYSCGYWENANNLDEAQEAKLDLICRKLGLKHGDRILDIGCGWGSFTNFATKKYGVHCVGITISKEQATLAKKKAEGLPVEIRFQDYREINEKFDHVMSVGMIEHVGYKNHRTYMEVVHRNLKDNGLFLLHTIGSNKSVKTNDSWIAKYIFPNSMLPSIVQLAKAFEGLFVMEDWHNFSADYDKTLMSWIKNFDAAWPRLKEKYDDRFYRMWKFYLLSCAASFRSRNNQLWQIVLSKNGVRGGYQSIR